MTGKVAEVALVAEIAAILRERRATLVVAESCTGGRIAAAFTAQAGASDYFLGGIVAYSNALKVEVLGVRADDLARWGAVSEPVARQMALGAKRITGADYAISTTGIAGPGGGTPAKPVGTVWMAVATPDGVFSRSMSPEGGSGHACAKQGGNDSRSAVMSAATAEAIELLRNHLNNPKDHTKI